MNSGEHLPAGSFVLPMAIMHKEPLTTEDWEMLSGRRAVIASPISRDSDPPKEVEDFVTRCGKEPGANVKCGRRSKLEGLAFIQNKSRT